jgi:hypothetical protein
VNKSKDQRIATLEAEVRRLEDDLQYAIQQIRVWHDIEEFRLPAEAKGRAWDIYWRHAPEMRRLRAAVAKRSDNENNQASSYVALDCRSLRNTL